MHGFCYILFLTFDLRLPTKALKSNIWMRRERARERRADTGPRLHRPQTIQAEEEVSAPKLTQSMMSCKDHKGSTPMNEIPIETTHRHLKLETVESVPKILLPSHRDVCVDYALCWRQAPKKHD